MIRLNLQQFGKGGSSGIGGSGKVHHGSAGASGLNFAGKTKAPDSQKKVDYNTPVTRLEKGEVYELKQIKNNVTRNYSDGDTYEDAKEVLKSFSYNKKTGTWTSKVRKDVQYIVRRSRR